MPHQNTLPHGTPAKIVAIYDMLNYEEQASNKAFKKMCKRDVLHTFLIGEKDFIPEEANTGELFVRKHFA